MGDLDDFFDFSKPFKREVVSGGYVNGRTLPDDKLQFEKLPKREVVGNDYSKDVIAAQQMGLLDDFCAEQPGPSSAASNLMETLEDSDCEDMEVDSEHKPILNEEIYEKYNFARKAPSDLPVFDRRLEILNLIEHNRIVILEGDTGCGKTTQIPQFILEQAYEKREYCNIICTQPRRIAAITVAQRVCDERNWKIGDIVGYQIGLRKENNPDTRLLYCTTGILLQKLIKTKSLSVYTHIVLDEVHERDQDMDFLLIVIKKLIRTSPNTKIILMSATINTKEFSEYFQMIKGKILIPAPILKVDTRRLYTVKDFYLDDLEKITSTIPDFKEDFETAKISKVFYRLVLKLILKLEVLDQSDEESIKFSHKPSILVFLPGINEIDSMEKTLEEIKTLDVVKVQILVVRLHSMISADDQQKAFRKPAPGYRKIILATNIAESSITVPDVKYVIDFCLIKNLVTDTNSGLTSLELQWASKANCKQRAGRAGRVMNGRVYRLVSRYFYNNCMPEQGTPEMTRCPLENIILKSKMLDMGAPHSILGLALSPPNLSDIRNTILILKEVGALFQTIDGKRDSNDGDLTFIGRVMAQLPIDVHVSRLIIFGYIFSILNETIIIAAGLNVKSIFDFPYQNQLSAYNSKLCWSDGSGSDLFAITRAYKVWVGRYEQQQFKREEAETSWTRRHYMNAQSMREMHYLILELKSRLESIGIKENTGYNRVNWLDHEQAIALKIAIAGAFYPNYFLRIASDQYENQRLAYQTLCGRNPCNTVYFMGLDNKYIGELYIKSIKDIFEKAKIAFKNVSVDFEEGTQKVFVKFNSDPTEKIFNNNNLTLALPGRVLPEVYKAIKMRQLRMPTSIRVMRPNEATNYATQSGIGKVIDGQFKVNNEMSKKHEFVIIPSVFTKFENGTISYIENCGKFWFQPKQVEKQLQQIIKEISNPENLYKFSNYSEIKRGMVLVAKHKGKSYRAKVLRRDEELKLSPVRYKVIFMDYGDTVSLDFMHLLGIRPSDNNSFILDLPPRVFECCLAGIMPSAVNSLGDQWNKESKSYFEKMIENQFERKKSIELEIYSVVNGISSVIIKTDSEVVNDALVEKNFAQYCEENYMSKIDNDLRTRKQYEQQYKNFDDFYKSEEEEKAIFQDYVRQCDGVVKQVISDPPPPSKCSIELKLRGPMSPLETTCNAVTRAGSWKTVRIERESINSVLLNADPQDNHDRLIVAATVHESTEKSSITARQTTIMPNIKGFAPLMALLFCPKVEIHRNRSKTKFSSILCGLGPENESSDQSMFAEHDIILNLNVEILPNDISIINQIRYSMDTILFTHIGEELPKTSFQDRYQLAAKIKQLIIGLLEKNRPYIEVEDDKNNVLWNQVDKRDVQRIRNVYGHRSIFPSHECMRLYSESYEHIENLKKNCETLYAYKELNSSVPDNLKCDLCGHKLSCIMQLRIHLLSKLHKDRENQINFKPKK